MQQEDIKKLQNLFLPEFSESIASDLSDADLIICDIKKSESMNATLAFVMYFKDGEAYMVHRTSAGDEGLVWTPELMDKSLIREACKGSSNGIIASHRDEVLKVIGE